MDCLTKNCSNNGTCVVQENIASCKCLEGYLGTFCDIQSTNLTNLGTILSKNLSSLNSNLLSMTNSYFPSNNSSNYSNSSVSNDSLANVFTPNPAINVSSLNNMSLLLLNYASTVKDVPAIHNPNNTKIINNFLSKIYLYLGQIVSTLSNKTNLIDQETLTNFLSIADCALTLNILE